MFIEPNAKDEELDEKLHCFNEELDGEELNDLLKEVDYEQD